MRRAEGEGEKEEGRGKGGERKGERRGGEKERGGEERGGERSTGFGNQRCQTHISVHKHTITTITPPAAWTGDYSRSGCDLQQSNNSSGASSAPLQPFTV